MFAAPCHAAIKLHRGENCSDNFARNSESPRGQQTSEGIKSCGGEKRRRSGAVQDAGSTGSGSRMREASWTAVALCRSYGRTHNGRENEHDVAWNKSLTHFEFLDRINRIFRIQFVLPVRESKFDAKVNCLAVGKRQRAGAVQDAGANDCGPACAKRLGLRQPSAAFLRAW